MKYFCVSTATEVLMTLIITIISGSMILLLIRSIRRENTRYATLTSKHLSIDISELKTYINREISTKRNDFVLIELTLNKIDNILKVCGDDQFSQASEEMLRRIKQIFQASARVSFISRDKLWIYVKSRFKPEALRLVLDTLIAEINKPIVLVGSLTVEFDVNIAAIMYNPSLGNLEKVCALIELTTIASLKKGINSAVIYDRTVSNISTEQYALFTDIQEAIRNKDFRIFYQPIIRTDSLECFSVEAFLRWQHESKGIISPDVFLPSLEHSGDINWVGLWALEEIAKQLEYWRINNPEVNIKININWSLSQLSNPTIVEEIRRILRKYNVQPSDFYFELANYKSALSIDAVVKNLAKIRSLGIGLAIDNISLEVETILSLKGGDVSMLKFNRDFVGKFSLDNEGAISIAEMVVKTAKANDIIVVAEGVEEEETLQKLAKTGIEMAQGYYISKPKSPTEIMAAVLLEPWRT